MTFAEFLKLVEEMRHSQKEFFRTKGRAVSVGECMGLERKVDLACRKLRDGQKELKLDTACKIRQHTRHTLEG